MLDSLHGPSINKMWKGQVWMQETGHLINLQIGSPENLYGYHETSAGTWL